MINLLHPLSKSALILLGLTSAESAADAGTHRKNIVLNLEVQVGHQH